jgi:hypothetical protein
LFRDSTARDHREAQARQRNLQGGEADTELARVNGNVTFIVRDVMQPLAAMVANAQAALHFLDRPDVDEVREALSCIVRDGARAAALVDRADDLCPRTSASGGLPSSETGAGGRLWRGAGQG